MKAETALADFIVGTGVAEIPEEVLAVTQRALLDTVAAVLVGVSSELREPLLGYLDAMPADGHSPVFGTERQTSPERAALVNGALGHAMDFDDTVSSMPGHPGAVVFSALLAALPHTPASGKDLLTAAAVGYEVATKLGRAIGMGHYNRGWHSTGSIGIFGATAAVGRLRGLTREQIRHALGIAASMSAGLRVNFGTMTKPLHSGWAASSGLTATMLASTGYTAAADALTGSGGLFEVAGDERSDPAVLELLGAPYTVVSPGIAFKKYACCYALHRAIDALTTLREDGVLGDPSEVQSVRARVAPGSLKPLIYRRPVTGLEGKFSMEYVLAAGVLDGRFALDAFTDEAVLRPAVRDILERTEAVESAECSPGDPEGRFASAGTRGVVEITVRKTDGTVHVRTVEESPGSPSRPLSDAEIVEKLRESCRFSGFPAERGERLLEIVAKLPELPDARVLIDILSLASIPASYAVPQVAEPFAMEQSG